MYQETLKQLTAFISAVIILFVLVSIIRNKMIWKYSIGKLKIEILSFSLRKIWIRIFLILSISALFFSLAYSSLDISKKISEDKKHTYFGEYSYAYLNSNVSGDITSVLDKQTPEIKQSKIQKGIYFNTSIKDTDTYKPNVTLLSFSSLNLNDNEFYSFSDNEGFSNNIEINGLKFIRKKDFDISQLNGLDNFRGFLISGNLSHNLLILNLKAATQVTNVSLPNIIFSHNSFDLTVGTLGKDNTSNNIPNIQTLSEGDFQKGIYNKINPFSSLMLIAVVVYIILLYPLFLAIKHLYNNQKNNLEYLRSTGASAGIVTKYLTHYFILPFLTLCAFATLFSYSILIFAYKVLNFSFLFGYENPQFVFDPFTLFFIFTNIFTLFFLIVFLIFYSVYTPQQKFKSSKISIIRLSLGITASLFGIVLLIFLKDLPESARGLIPFLVFCGPVTSLLGTTIFLRLNNFYRNIVLAAASGVLIIGSLIMFVTQQFNNTPAGILIIGFVSVFLIANIINEFGYKDYFKLISIGLILYLSVIVITISFIGINLNSAKYSFDLSVQTYSIVDKSKNISSLFPSNSIKTQISTVDASQIVKNKSNADVIYAVFSLVSTDKANISATNLSMDEINKFYKDNDSVILSPEFKNKGYLEGDTIILQDLISNQKVTKKIFKIMSDNLNTDLSEKIIFPNLPSDFNTPRSTLNQIYVIKFDNLNYVQQKANTIQQLYKYNIFDIQDVDQKLKDTNSNSIKLFESVKIILVLFSIFILIITITRDLFKGIIMSVIIIIYSFISGFIYSHFVGIPFILDDNTRNLLIILILSVIITYGTNFAYRKVKTRQ